MNYNDYWRAIEEEAMMARIIAEAQMMAAQPPAQQTQNTAVACGQAAGGGGHNDYDIFHPVIVPETFYLKMENGDFRITEDNNKLRQEN